MLTGQNNSQHSLGKCNKIISVFPAMIFVRGFCYSSIIAFFNLIIVLYICISVNIQHCYHRDDNEL